MTVWGWILFLFLSLAGCALLLLALFHVRFRASWSGTLGPAERAQGGEARLEYGFPGFMRAWTPDADAPAPSGAGSEDADVPAPSGAGPVDADAPAPSGAGPVDADAPAPSGAGPVDAGAPARSPAKRRRRKDPHRWRRALFRLATDAPAWKIFMQYDLATLRRLVRLLHLRADMEVGHPDPALLGRLSGYWHAASPLLPGNLTLGFRFQDRIPTFAVRAQGGFSALSLMAFSVKALLTFPWLGLGRRARHAWKGHALEGWRGRIYRKLQTLG